MNASICRQINVIFLQLLFLTKRSYWSGSRSARHHKNEEILAGQGAAFKLRADLSALFGMGCSIARGRLKPASRMNPAPELHRLLLRASLGAFQKPRGGALELVERRDRRRSLRRFVLYAARRAKRGIRR